MNVLDLFSGIGGFSLGLEQAGFKTVAFCEIDPYCRAVLRKHWPDVPVFGDIRELTAQVIADTIGSQLRQQSGLGNGSSGASPAQPGFDGSQGTVADTAWDVRGEQASGWTERQRTGTSSQSIDVICGGFPCQDISVAGKRAGIEGERSGLWSEYARIIGEVRPRYVIVENVAALLNRGLERVLGDLAALGYDAEWHCIPASAVGAPHRRDRLWLVAHARRLNCDGWRCECGGQEAAGSRDRSTRSGQHADDVADADKPRLEGWLRASLRECAEQRVAWAGDPSIPDTGRDEAERHGPDFRAPSQSDWWLTEPDVGRVAHGVPARVDRLRALGNAIVPQIAEIIGKAIIASEKSVRQ